MWLRRIIELNARLQDNDASRPPKGLQFLLQIVDLLLQPSLLTRLVSFYDLVMFGAGLPTFTRLMS